MTLITFFTKMHAVVFQFETVPVRHCSNAYGLVVTHQEGWKIVYSGDTMPCDALVTAGEG